MLRAHEQLLLTWLVWGFVLQVNTFTAERYSPIIWRDALPQSLGTQWAPAHGRDEPLFKPQQRAQLYACAALHSQTCAQSLLGLPGSHLAKAG
jgi:hypothetical protein